MEVKNNAGVMFKEEKFIVVKKVAKKGDLIDKHNHPEAKVLFTVIKGEFAVLLNDTEKFLLQPGQVLSFDGNNYISAECLASGEAVVTLINK